MKALMLALGLVLAAASAEAQAPFPGAVNVNGGWVPCDHPIATAAGQSCSPTPLAGDAPVPNLPPECHPWPNPYAEPVRAVRCTVAVGGKIAPTTPAYRVMGQYGTPYNNQRIVVLSVTRGVDESVVVTAQWLTPSAVHPDSRRYEIGDVFAFKASSTDIWRQEVP